MRWAGSYWQAGDKRPSFLHWVMPWQQGITPANLGLCPQFARVICKCNALLLVHYTIHNGQGFEHFLFKLSLLVLNLWLHNEPLVCVRPQNGCRDFSKDFCQAFQCNPRASFRAYFFFRYLQCSRQFIFPKAQQFVFHFFPIICARYHQKK